MNKQKWWLSFYCFRFPFNCFSNFKPTSKTLVNEYVNYLVFPSVAHSTVKIPKDDVMHLCQRLPRHICHPWSSETISPSINSMLTPLHGITVGQNMLHGYLYHIHQCYQIGRASCRERVCQSVIIEVEAGCCNKKHEYVHLRYVWLILR